LPIAKIRSGDCLTVTDITLESRLVSPGDSTLMKAFPAFWDYISLQQVSGKSGQYDTYKPYLSNLVNYVKGCATTNI